MSIRLPLICAAAVALAPAAAFAKGPADTRLRPNATAPSTERHLRDIKCHHEASKATTCIGYNHMAKQRREAAQLTDRR